METIKIHPDKLFTKSEYSKEFGISRMTIDKRIAENDLSIIKVRGTTLIKVA